MGDLMRTIILIGLFLLCQIAAFVTAIRMAWAIITNQDRAWNIAKAYDRLGNSATNDDTVQTISSRAELARRDGKRWGCWLCGILDRIQTDHCKNSAGV